MLLNEVAPAAPFLIEALPTLTLLAALLFVVGCIYVLRQFVKALFGGIASLFSFLPFVGGLTADALHSAEHAISNALGEAESYFDAHIAAQFHRLARLADHLWNQLVSLAHTSLMIAETLSGYASLRDILRLERSITKRLHAAEHEAATALRHGLAHARAFTRSVAQGIYPRIRAVEHDVTRTLPREIRHARTLAREAEDEALRAYKLAKANARVVESAAFAGAVAWALSRIGLGWTRCNNNGALGRAVCGLESNLLQDLLAGMFAAGAVVEFRELVKVAQGVEREVAAGVKDLLDV